MINRIGYIFLICACCLSQAQAQSSNLVKVENELLAAFKKIAEWRFSEKEGYYDSVLNANDIFTKKLLSFIKRNPSTISHPFKKMIQEGFDVATSKDGNLRIYSWDTWSGGTMHFFDNLLQFRENDKVHTKYFIDEEGTDAKSYYDSIYQTNVGNETIYLATNYTIGSTRDRGGSIKLYKIFNGQLKDANIIKTSTGLHNSIYYYYDAVLKDYKQDWPSCYFDATTQTILIPLIYDSGKPSGKFIKYKFDGKYFQKVK